MKIALTMKFSPHIHGIYLYEQKFVKYMTYKNFIMQEINLEEEGETIFSLIDWINNQQMIGLKLSFIKNKYNFLGREFANLNNGIEIFQKKYKQYYKAKLSYYKNPKNLRKREILGYFPKYRIIN